MVARQACRLRAVANVIDGLLTRSTAARAAGVMPQTLRVWVVRYNEQSVDGVEWHALLKPICHNAFMSNQRSFARCVKHIRVVAWWAGCVA